ncbi:MAG: TraR/DksA family transcriptional regulator [Saprospiraceae bacterium]|jgi:DnaK suppressor protein
MQPDKEEIRKLIEKEIEKTRDRIAEYEEMAQPITPDDAIGRVSRMDAIVNKSVVEAALREARQKLSNLEEMQGKIDKPDFGICSKCGKPIPIRRLMLMPQSSLCVNCAR